MQRRRGRAVFSRTDVRYEESTSTYAQLAAPFDVTFTDVRGGIEVTFISGEQVVSRLNEVLGVAGWSFRVLRQEIHAEADEVWALGELVADIGGKTVARQQFGSQKIKRSRSTGVPLDLGFDLKGATTDAHEEMRELAGRGAVSESQAAARPHLARIGGNGMH